MFERILIAAGLIALMLLMRLVTAKLYARQTGGCANSACGGGCSRHSHRINRSADHAS
ncbi:MAG: hypothetical protein QNJ40_06150 [Xanthomonadales bacterium]|nr:hypothetical protein [Xanthomonadales bacterium]